MHDTGDEKKDADIKVDVGLKTEIKADLAPVISATPTGLKYVFNLLLGKKHAAAERMIKLADAQNTVDIKKIMNGDAIYDQKSNQLIEVKTINPKALIAEKIQNDEITNLIECSMHAATHINDNEDPEFTGAAEDFLSRWKSEAKHFSTEEARVIWGRVLAEEVNTPGSISLRTMDIIKNLSKKEASTFNEACKFVVFERYIVDNNTGSPITSEAFSEMRNAGLIINYSKNSLTSSSWLETTLTIPNETPLNTLFIRCADHFIFLDKDDLERSGIAPPKFNYWEMTAAGCELYKIIRNTLNANIQEILESLLDVTGDTIKKVKYTKYTNIDNYQVDTDSIKNF